jgi:hypothetical protein
VTAQQVQDPKFKPPPHKRGRVHRGSMFAKPKLAIETLSPAAKHLEALVSEKAV